MDKGLTLLLQVDLMCVVLSIKGRASVLSVIVQHGTPLQAIDIGETALDEETFHEYLSEMREHYTADKVCNRVSNLAELI